MASDNPPSGTSLQDLGAPPGFTFNQFSPNPAFISNDESTIHHDFHQRNLFPDDESPMSNLVGETLESSPTFTQVFKDFPKVSQVEDTNVLEPGIGDKFIFKEPRPPAFKGTIVELPDKKPQASPTHTKTAVKPTSIDEAPFTMTSSAKPTSKVAKPTFNYELEVDGIMKALQEHGAMMDEQLEDIFDPTDLPFSILSILMKLKISDPAIAWVKHTKLFTMNAIRKFSNRSARNILNDFPIKNFKLEGFKDFLIKIHALLTT